MSLMREEQVVVFIHGLGDTPDAWDSQIDALPAGFRAVVIDVPALAAVRSRTGSSPSLRRRQISSESLTASVSRRLTSADSPWAR